MALTQPPDLVTVAAETRTPEPIPATSILVGIAEVGVRQAAPVVAEFMGQGLHNGRMICAHPDVPPRFAISTMIGVAKSIIYFLNHYYVKARVGPVTHDFIQFGGIVYCNVVPRRIILNVCVFKLLKTSQNQGELTPIFRQSPGQFKM